MRLFEPGNYSGKPAKGHERRIKQEQDQQILVIQLCQIDHVINFLAFNLPVRNALKLAHLFLDILHLRLIQTNSYFQYRLK